MTEKDKAFLRAIEMVASMESYRIAMAAVNQAVAMKMLPQQGYAIHAELTIEPKLIITPAVTPSA